MPTRHLIWLWAFLLTLVWTPLAQAFPNALIQSVKGQVWAGDQRAKSGIYLGEKVVLRTGGKSSAVLKFPDGQLVVVGEESRFRLDEYHYEATEPAKDRSLMSALQGSFRFISGLLANRNRRAFEVETPVATLGIRGTDFAVVLERGTYTGVKEGVVALKNGADILEVGAGKFGYAASRWTRPTLIPKERLPGRVKQRFEAVNAISTAPPKPPVRKRPPPKPPAGEKEPAAPSPAPAPPGTAAPEGGRASPTATPPGAAPGPTPGAPATPAMPAAPSGKAVPTPPAMDLPVELQAPAAPTAPSDSGDAPGEPAAKPPASGTSRTPAPGPAKGGTPALEAKPAPRIEVETTPGADPESQRLAREVEQSFPATPPAAGGETATNGQDTPGGPSAAGKEPPPASARAPADEPFQGEEDNRTPPEFLLPPPHRRPDHPHAGDQALIMAKS